MKTKRLQRLLLLAPVLLLAGCPATLPISTQVPSVVECPRLPAVPPSLSAKGMPPFVPGKHSINAAANIESWQKSLTESSSSSPPPSGTSP